MPTVKKSKAEEKVLQPTHDTIQIRVNVSRQTLLDLLVTAVEGGSNYWATFKDAKRDGDLNYTQVTVTEWEAGVDEQPLTRVVDVNTMARGLEKLGNAAATEKFPAAAQHFADAFADHDAITADVVLQMAMFGDVIYG